MALLRRVLKVIGLVMGIELVALLGLLFYRRLERPQRHVRFPHEPLPPVEVAGHRLTIYNYGEDVFRAMLDDIGSAREEVLLETYIFRNDEVGNTFRKRLIRQAQRGVGVFLIFDGLGSLALPDRYKRFPRSIHSFEFGPLHSLRTFMEQRVFVRTHRKILVVDEQVAYICGLNIGKEYRRRWRDTSVKIEGPMSRTAAEAFECFWNAYREPDDPEVTVNQIVENPAITIAVNDPIRQMFPIADAYIQALHAAKKHVRISSAYFAPTEPVYAAIIAAANRGVHVEIMLSDKSDVVYADWGARGLYEDLLAHGVDIWLYQQTVNHSKTCTIDGNWSTIGSANLDHLSLNGNFEIIAIVEDEAFAAQMERMWAMDIGNCRQVDKAAWAQRSWLERVLEVAVLPLYRFM